MEPVALVLAALAAGAHLDGADQGASVLKDAYAGLKALVSGRLDGVPDAELLLSGFEQAPGAWRERLSSALGRAGAGHDQALAEAAAAFIRLAEEAGWPAARHVIDAQGARGVQVGNYNAQVNSTQIYVHGNLTWIARDDSSPVADTGKVVSLSAGVSRPEAAGARAGWLHGYMAAVEQASAAHPYFGSALGTPALSAVYRPQLADRGHEEPHGGNGTPGPGQSPGDAYRLSAADILAAAGPCVVLAGPGGGKSSLMRACARETAEQWSRGLADSAVPVLVPAVALAGRRLLEAAAAAVTAELEPYGLDHEITADFLRERPGPGVPWLFLVDGIDELTSADARQDLLRRLSAVESQSSGALRVAVATRPLPPGELELLGPGVIRHELRRFDPGDVLKVASDWFTALAMTDATAATDRFASALARRARLPELARTPLMTAMLCQLFAANPDRELPDSRGAIYRDFRNLLVQRLKARGLSGAYRQADEALERYGPTAQGHGRRVLDEIHEIVGQLAVERHRGATESALKIIASQPATQVSEDLVPQAEWRAYLDATLRRSGLLIPRAGDFTFLHQTLQDYLAARCLVTGTEGQALLREVLRLKRPLAGRARWGLPSEDISFLSFLIDPGDGADTSTAQALERVAAQGGLDGCRFITALTQLGTRLPDSVTRQAVSSVEKRAHRSVGKSSWDPIYAARVLADLDWDRGLDLFESLATGGRRFDALREIAALAPARAADPLAALAADSEASQTDRLRAARLLFRVDPDRGGGLLQAIASDASLTSILRADAGRLLSELDPVRGADLHEHVILDSTRSHWEREHSARILAAIDPARAASVLERAVRNAEVQPYKRKGLAVILASADRPRAIEVLESLAATDRLNYSWKEALTEIREAPAEPGPATSISERLDNRDITWLLSELSRLRPRRTGLAGRVNGLPEGDHQASGDVLARLDDPRAADLLYGIACDPERRVWWDGAACQLARIKDPRAADLIAAMVQDAGFYPFQRVTLIMALSDLDLERAAKLMSALAADPNLNKNAQRKVKQAQAKLLARLHPGIQPTRK